MNVLFLTPWYPSPADEMAGLFVRKHAMAVARYDRVCVLYMEAREGITTFEVVPQETEGVHEVYVFFPFTDLGPLRQITKSVNFVRAFRRGMKVVDETFGRPDVTQVSVLTRCGVLAWWLKKTRGVPYAIIEHWSRYTQANFNYRGFLRKRLTEMVVRDAHEVMAVSNHLRKTMMGLGLVNLRFGLIDNVVDDFFYTSPRVPRQPGEPFRFLHISCFDEKPKNVQGILRAVKALSLVRQDFRLTLVGNGPDWQAAVDVAHSLGLDDLVTFVGVKPPSEVCAALAVSDVFVLFSRFENAPVVISEALAMGVPVISSIVGGVPDMVHESDGFLIPVGDEATLVEKMAWMIDHAESFNPDVIRQSAARFSFDAVGQRLHSVYVDSQSERC